MKKPTSQGGSNQSNSILDPVTAHRLDLARVLNKLGRKEKALALIKEIQASFEKIEGLDEEDQELLSNALELRKQINQSEA